MAEALEEPAFDQELLLWLGDEAPAVRAADVDRVRDIAAEFVMLELVQEGDRRQRARAPMTRRRARP